MLSNGARGCEKTLSLSVLSGNGERENFFTTLCGLVYSIGRQGAAAAAHNEISCQTRLPVLSVTAITIQLPTQWHCHKLNPSAPRRTPCPPPVCSPSPRVVSDARESEGGGSGSSSLSAAPISPDNQYFFQLARYFCK